LHFEIICLAFCISVTFNETDDLFKELQRRMDSLRNDIYKDYTPKIRVSISASLVQGECFCTLAPHKVYFEDNDHQTQSTAAHFGRVRVLLSFSQLNESLPSFSSKELPLLLE
jgi:hypothetical protein